MNFLHASQNESMFMATEGSRLCSENLGQFEHHPAKREGLLQFIHSFLAVPGTSSGRCCYPCAVAPQCG